MIERTAEAGHQLDLHRAVTGVGDIVGDRRGLAHTMTDDDVEETQRLAPGGTAGAEARHIEVCVAAGPGC